jgi:hypothetical protein
MRRLKLVHSKGRLQSILEGDDSSLSELDVEMILDELGRMSVDPVPSIPPTSPSQPVKSSSNKCKEFSFKGGAVTDAVPFVPSKSEHSNPLFEGIFGGTLDYFGVEQEVIIKENARARSINQEASVLRYLQSHKGKNSGCIRMFGFDTQVPPTFIVIERYGINLHAKLGLKRRREYKRCDECCARICSSSHDGASKSYERQAGYDTREYMANTYVGHCN